jgi:hypothetical protein
MPSLYREMELGLRTQIASKRKNGFSISKVPLNKQLPSECANRKHTSIAVYADADKQN